MSQGKVVGIFIAPKEGDRMQSMQKVTAETGSGLVGDRYATGEGSFNKGRPGKRQVTFINAQFFPGSGFEYADSRRNIVTEGVELMRFIGEEFRVGVVLFRGVRYCYPCNRPNQLARVEHSFQKAFFDRGGLIAEVVEGGVIHVNDTVALFAKS